MTVLQKKTSTELTQFGDKKQNVCLQLSFSFKRFNKKLRDYGLANYSRGIYEPNLRASTLPIIQMYFCFLLDQFAVNSDTNSNLKQ